MRIPGVALLLSFTSCILIYLSCRRLPDQSFERSVEARFFSLPANTHPLVKTLSGRIFEQNQRKRFVNGLVNRTGYPAWNKAMVMNRNQQTGATGRTEGGGNETAVFIPFIKTNSATTNSVLNIHISGTDTTYKLVYAEEYANYGFDTSRADHWDARDIFHLFTLFDNMLFGHTEFQVNDGRLFGGDTSYKPRVILNDGPGQGCENCSMMPVTVCNTYIVCGNCLAFRSESLGGECCFPREQILCTTFWIEIGSGGGGTGNGGQPGGGGGNGGTGGPGGNNPSWGDDPCEEDPYNSGRVMPCDGVTG